jgi:hypothetical protein
MMKHIYGFLHAVLFFTVLSLAPVGSFAQSDSFSAIESHFKNIPDSQQLGVYWYWMSDNLSREGVIKDLQAMKRAGINRAYIGNIGEPSVPFGKVKVFTDEWWDILHTALKTASELNIEIGIFNSPGWSQSGGPWVKPSQAMRYLASRTIQVKGPIKLHQQLPSVGKDAQDVKVLAYPTLSSDCSFMSRADMSKAYEIDLVSTKPSVVRSLTIQTVMKSCKTDAEFFVKEGSAYRSLCKFKIDRSRSAINVGFDPYAPIVISLPEVKGSEFRLVIDKAKAGMIQSVTLSDIPKVERYPEKTLAKMYQAPHPMFYEYEWKQQPECSDAAKVIPVNKVTDITSFMSADGMLTWKVPKGEWTIMRTAMVPTGQTNSPATPEATGLETDKMSKEHIAAHFDGFIGEILRRIPASDRTTFHVVVADSYETGGQNWTDHMMSDFVARYGYSPVPYLPVYQGVVVGSEDQSDRFLWDVRRLVADEIAYNYVGGLRDVSHKHGLTIWLENYGHWGFPGEFLQYGGQSDEIAGEFWCVGYLGSIENRAASSCGHIYGKNKIWAESFTSGGPDFYRYPGSIKARGDKFFTEGINATLFHVSIEQPDERVPGLNASFGTEFNRHNTWFPQLDVFSKYIKRCNYMLQQGRYIADVAYYIGEDAPKMIGSCEPALPKGYSYDFINAEVLLNDASVELGALTLKSGMKYKVLVLPKLDAMRPEVLKQIKKLVSEGLVIVGPAPTRSPSLQNYPQADAEVQNLAIELWNGKGVSAGRLYDTYGKGRIYPSASMEQVLTDIGMIPDFSASPADSVLFIHRRLAEGDIYFISNQKNKEVTFPASFRTVGRVPELWNPQTAEIRRLPEYQTSANTTDIPMTLQAGESAFVIFRLPASFLPTTEKGSNYPEKKVLAEVKGPWTVSFQEGRGGPDKPVIFSSLTDWTQNGDERIKYFSGTATYATQFTVGKLPGSQLYLNLGHVMVMAKVKLNGKEVGGVWTYPYRLNVTNALQRGKNILEVEVVNGWMNRLIRDKSLPENERITWQTYSYWKPNSPLQSSGLLGPVEVQAYDYKGFLK